MGLRENAGNVTVTLPDEGILDRRKCGEALGKGEGLCTGIPDGKPLTNNIGTNLLTASLIGRQKYLLALTIGRNHDEAPETMIHTPPATFPPNAPSNETNESHNDTQTKWTPTMPSNISPTHPAPPFFPAASTTAGTSAPTSERRTRLHT